MIRRAVGLTLPLAVAVGLAACDGSTVAIEGGGLKSSATVRATRRAFDGAPPVIPHDNFGMSCTQCHNRDGMEVPEVGFAPASPHEATSGMSSISRCRQCHVFRVTDDVFVDSSFVALRQDLRSGRRLNDLAPPVIPHKSFMRENCAACHSGTAAREEIRTSHPERIRCTQCHVVETTRSIFRTEMGPGSD